MLKNVFLAGGSRTPIGMFNGAFAAGVLYKTWDMHQSKIRDLDLGNAGTDPAVPDFLEECKWETDWILKMQQTNGMIHNIVGHCPSCWSRIRSRGSGLAATRV